MRYSLLFLAQLANGIPLLTSLAQLSSFACTPISPHGGVLIPECLSLPLYTPPRILAVSWFMNPSSPLQHLLSRSGISPISPSMPTHGREFAAIRSPFVVLRASRHIAPCRTSGRISPSTPTLGRSQHSLGPSSRTLTILSSVHFLM